MTYMNPLEELLDELKDNGIELVNERPRADCGALYLPPDGSPARMYIDPALSNSNRYVLTMRELGRHYTSNMPMHERLTRAYAFHRCVPYSALALMLEMGHTLDQIATAFFVPLWYLKDALNFYGFTPDGKSLQRKSMYDGIE